MDFESVLFLRVGERAVESEAPAYLRDLNLDQIVAAVTAGFDEYNLAPLFHATLRDVDAITYRQEVMRDLEDATAMAIITDFASSMRSVRRQLAKADKVRYERERQRRTLGAAQVYCEAVEKLQVELCARAVRSRALRALGAYLEDYVRTAGFSRLVADVARVSEALRSIRYTLLLDGRSIHIQVFAGEPDQAALVAETFERFRRGDGTQYAFRFRESDELNHVEAAILEHVAQLHPEVFRDPAEFCASHRNFVDEAISTFDREVHFYVAYLAHIGRLKKAGLSFCFPRVSASSKEVRGRDVFDLALANELVREGRQVVCNDFGLRAPERIFVVSGPNQGGKTTFARTFGQLHHLASLGCPVPGSDAQVFLFDRILTHFERVENVANLRGKLHDELVRIRHVLDRATPASIVVLNEIFSSTTLHDAVFLSTEILRRISVLDVLCVCVTFLDELASLDHKTVSLVAEVDEKDPSVRTFQLRRRPPDGLAHALAIAERHRVTYRWLKDRVHA